MPLRLTPEAFDNIYHEQLTPIQKRILRRLLRGKSYQSIRGDKTVWIDREVLTERNQENLPPRQRERLEMLEAGQLMEQSLLAHHLRGICQTFGVESTGNLTDDLRQVIKNCAMYIPDFVTIDALEQYELNNSPMPNGPVSTDSIYYQERSPIEQNCYACLNNAGEQAILLRLKAPNLMGKTSLIRRLLNNTMVKNGQGKAVYLDLNTDREILTPDVFYPWLCNQIGRQIGLDIRENLKSQWDRESPASSACDEFLEDFILSKIDKPIFLGLDNLLCVSKNPALIDFLEKLRAWHEKGVNNQLWRKLVLILAYSTDDYVIKGLAGSPLSNVGKGQELREFNDQEVLNLSQKHSLRLTETERKDLQEMIGGHPYLIRQAMYSLSQEKKTLETIFAEAETEVGIYHEYLSRLYRSICQYSLKECLKKVIESNRPVVLNPIETFELYSLGLVLKTTDGVEIRCRLYREYFTRYLAL
ncbi:MAG: AAA-like domain-containing protein [Aphanizomenon gracile PMC644.10]|nr:AAA-like domain-containing protein [Aphanizomenon gracile PMC644.10]